MRITMSSLGSDIQDEDDHQDTINPPVQPPDPSVIPTDIEWLEPLTSLHIKRDPSRWRICLRQVYHVLDPNTGNEMMRATETTFRCLRWCCSFLRGSCPFSFSIQNSTGITPFTSEQSDQDLPGLHLFGMCGRPWDYVYLFHQQDIQQGLGGLHLECCSALRPTKFVIRDAQWKRVLSIKGPWGSVFFGALGCGSCYNATFHILDLQGSIVGAIHKDMTQTVEHRTILTFPQDLDIKLKAVLMATAIFIDYMFF